MLSYVLMSEFFTRGVCFHRFLCLKEAFRETISLLLPEKMVKMSKTSVKKL